MVADTKKPNLIVRADANSRIGSGHLMRSMALAQSWRAHTGGTVIFVTNCETDALREKLKTKGRIFEIENSYPHAADWTKTREVLENYRKSWCVVDGYNFDAGFHGKIRENGNRVLVIDDTAHLDFYDADAVLNQNINAADLQYNHAQNTALLLGTQYALLRDEFTAWKTWRRETFQVARKILITMGGSDFYNLTLKAIRAVEQLAIENLEVKAVVGASNPHYAELVKSARHSSVQINLIKNADNMSELMAWADVSVSAAGSTCWELAFMQLPSILIVSAENQIGLARGLGETGFAENLGWFEQVSETNLASSLNDVLLDEKRRRKMSETGRGIVDGRGAERVAEFLSR